MSVISITCLSENTVRRHDLLASHGQSLIIKYYNKTYIYDTGEIYEGFTNNAMQLGFSLDTVDALILSHNHLDHSGALYRLLPSLTKQRLYLPPDMQKTDESKYAHTYRGDMSQEEAVEKILSYPYTTVVQAPLQLEENLYLTGPLMGNDCLEQSLVMNIPKKGLMILVGCSHPGLPSIIQKAREVTGQEKIYGLIGGLHLLEMNQQQLSEQVSLLMSLEAEVIVPSHCTGFNAIRLMQEKMGDVVKVSATGQFGVGNTLTILPNLSFDFK